MQWDLNCQELFYIKYIPSVHFENRPQPVEEEELNKSLQCLGPVTQGNYVIISVTINQESYGSSGTTQTHSKAQHCVNMSLAYWGEINVKNGIG